MSQPTLRNVDSDSATRISATRILARARQKEHEMFDEFLAAISGELILEAIEQDENFAQILRYALDKGLIRQADLSTEIRYANSQVGRWASGKAAPPYIVRERVIGVMRNLIEQQANASPQ